MSGAFPLLAGFEIWHDYFADPAACRLSFEPDGPTAAWLDRARCHMRAVPNGFRILYEASADAPESARAFGLGPTRLRFDVRAADPQFAGYTDGLSGGDAQGLRPAFDSRRAAAAGAFWLAPLSKAPGRPTGLRLAPDFRVILATPRGPSAAGRTYRARLASREAVWKYLLVGDWAAERPCVIDATPMSARMAFGPEASSETLADGRTALAIRAARPVGLTDRSGRRIELWSRTETGERDRLLMSNLPVASVANLAVEDPAAIVCEVFLSR